MRSVLNQDQFTPFGLWIRQYLPKSEDGISVTNLDYIIEDFRNKKIMLLEEKSNGGKLHRAQCLTFEVLDRVLFHNAPKLGYEYWGMFILQFPHGCDMPGPGMKLNDMVISAEKLQAHLSFKDKAVEPFRFKWRKDLVA